MILATLFACTVTPPPPAKPDVLFVVLDTLRADMLGAYGREPSISAQFDAVADAGVLFEDVMAPSVWTYPSHAAMFTGRYPWENGAHNKSSGESGKVTPLREGLPTLAGTLSSAGYETVSLAANCWLSPEMGLVRGFDRAECTDSDFEILERAMAVMSAERDKPLFLFVNLLTVHSPYLIQPKIPFSAQHSARVSAAGAPEWAQPFLNAERGDGLYFQQRWPGGDHLTGETAYTLGLFDIPEEDLGMVHDLYAGGVVGADQGLVKLISAWNAAGNTSDMVVVTSDHGEALGEGHRLGHSLRFGADVLSVPLAIVYSGHIPSGSRVSEPVSLRRIAPTILDLAGVEGDLGRSMMPMLDGAPPGEEPMAALWVNTFYTGNEEGAVRVALRDGDVTAVVQEDGVQVFAHKSDPSFTTDLSAGRDTTAWQATAAEIAKAGSVDTEAVPVSDDINDMLQAMGYIDED
jgi:arylsulfatase A-like enzyme